MWRVEDSVSIGRDPGEVFAFISNPENEPLWQSSAESSVLDAEEPVVGARNRSTVRLLGRRLDFVWEISELDPPKRVSYKKVEGPFGVDATYLVEPEGDGSRVTVTGEGPGFEGAFGSVADPVINKILAREIRGDLDKLKVLLEEGVEQEL